MCRNTIRPTNVRASVGSSASGSSARPIVSIPPARDSAATEPPAPVASSPVATTAKAARARRARRVRILFISPLLTLVSAPSRKATARGGTARIYHVYPFDAYLDPMLVRCSTWPWPCRLVCITDAWGRSDLPGDSSQDYLESAAG